MFNIILLPLIFALASASDDHLSEHALMRQEWVASTLHSCISFSDINSASVRNLRTLVETDSLIRMLLKRTFQEAHNKSLIVDKNYTCDGVNYTKLSHPIPYLLFKLEDIMHSAPELKFLHNGTSLPHNTITVPLAEFYGPFAMTESGEALSYLQKMNDWWLTYLKEWGDFLSSPASAYAADSWVNDERGSEFMKMDTYQIPDGGYASWNDWFIRELKPGKRPIHHPDDNSFVTSCCDATTWHAERQTATTDTFWIKAQPYDLTTLLNNELELINRYCGGVLLQTVLMPADYHRWHAPVTGRITKVELVSGTYFTQINYLGSEHGQLQYWTGNIPYMAHLNIRSIIEIDTADQGGQYNDGNIGKVLFIAVGLQDVSSLINLVSVGDVVKKGDQLGYFQYGGSTVLYLFPGDTIDGWIVTPPITIDPDNPFDPQKHGEKVQMGQALFNAIDKGPTEKPTKKPTEKSKSDSSGSSDSSDSGDNAYSRNAINDHEMHNFDSNEQESVSMESVVTFVVGITVFVVILICIVVGALCIYSKRKYAQHIKVTNGDFNINDDANDEEEMDAERAGISQIDATK
eukprot:432151_1